MTPSVKNDRGLMLQSSWAKGDGRFNAVIETWGDLPQTLDLKVYEKVVLPWIFTDEFYSIPGAIEQIINIAVNYPFPPTTHGLYHQSRAILKSDTRNMNEKHSLPHVGSSW